MSKNTKLPVISKGLEDSEIPYWRALESNGRKARVGKFGVDLGKRGTYDLRNPLNDLTGREWIYFLNSVWVTAYPPVADTYGFDIRKIHPSPKPPQLMADLISFFTKPNDVILDPFAGVGGTLLGANIATEPRSAVGLEISQRYIDAYQQTVEHLKFPMQTMICADARMIPSIEGVSNREFDLVVTDPPYFDMMSRKKSGQKKKLYGIDDASPFSYLEGDLANLPYESFLSVLKDILESAVSLLKDKRYLVVFCRDFQPTAESDNMLHADLVKKILEIPGLRYRGMRIWHDQSTDLYPFGYPFAFVMNQMHQYILIFRKE